VANRLSNVQHQKGGFIMTAREDRLLRVAAGLLLCAGFAAPAVAATVNFFDKGTFAAPEWVESDMRITAESSPGVAGNLYFLNFNGLAVQGGANDNVIDGTERVFFTVTSGAALTGVTLHQTVLINSNGNGVLGEGLIEGFLGATSLGTRTIGGTFVVDVSSLFSGLTLTSFSVRANPDVLRLYSLDFTVSSLELHWANAQSGQWGVAANWSPALVPGVLSNVVIDPVSGVIVSGPASNTTVSALTVGAQASGVAVLNLSAAADLQVTGTATVQSRGAIELGAANVLHASQLDNAGVVQGSGQVDARLNNLAGGRVSVGTGQRVQFTGAGTHQNAGMVDVLGGEVAFVGAVVNAAGTGLIVGRDALLRFTGGLTNQGSLALSSGNADVFGDITNTGSIALGARTTVNVYDDLVQNGAFVVPTSSAATLYGAFTGSGGFTGGGEVVVLGDLQPGNSPAVVVYGGDLTLGPTAHTAIEIEGLLPGQYDVLQVTGDATLGGTLGVTIGDGFSLGLGQSFVFFTAGGGLTGVFAGLADGSAVGSFGGMPLYIHYAAGSVSLQTAPVPEPETYVLMVSGLGLLALAVRRRRSRNT
jgi:hypothetical protein